MKIKLYYLFTNTFLNLTRVTECSLTNVRAGTYACVIKVNNTAQIKKKSI